LANSSAASQHPDRCLSDLSRRSEQRPCPQPSTPRPTIQIFYAPHLYASIDGSLVL